MKGFSNKAIVLLPKEETYTSRSELYQIKLKRAINNIQKYLSNYSIDCQLFNTNEMAHQLKPIGYSWISTCTPEDEFFLRNSCDGFETLEDGENLDGIYIEARSKYPVQRGLSFEERSSIVMKREIFIANKYIEISKLIVDFQHDKNSYYKVTSNTNDGRLILKVSVKNFMVTAEMSGNPIDIGLLIDGVNPYSTLDTWY